MDTARSSNVFTKSSIIIGVVPVKTLEKWQGFMVYCFPDEVGKVARFHGVLFS